MSCVQLGIVTIGVTIFSFQNTGMRYLSIFLFILFYQFFLQTFC